MTCVAEVFSFQVDLTAADFPAELASMIDRGWAAQPMATQRTESFVERLRILQKSEDKPCFFWRRKNPGGNVFISEFIQGCDGLRVCFKAELSKRSPAICKTPDGYLIPVIRTKETRIDRERYLPQSLLLLPSIIL